ncbi:hypothetical protein A2Y83_03485 [Candidatus Falkowbacteria bacterium RBG_13_39_14]|uniref:SpoVT-AbrB domain-containing protein n=1 Tax=Candidatus Falkowbacteria bacterium RBG_13_39_14 TaxID=1797985 RepID=A0A1F5S4V7_9BACT|nr:MAG: hypothetical protein A2Y83_03485 [Candidatus Falkowbacteria bacterium RBG_13_39_14]
MTQKGQITIPKKIRSFFNLMPSQKLIIQLEKEKNSIKIKPSQSFLDAAKKIKVRKKTNVLKAREAFEKNYGRI